MVAIRTDVIDPLDAAFRLDAASDSEWVSRVATAMKPLSDEGRGTYAWLVRRNAGAPDTFEALVDAEAPDPLMQAVATWHQDASPEDHAIAYAAGRLGLHSLATKYGARQFYDSPLLRRLVHDRGMIDAGVLHISLGERKLLVGSFLRAPATFPVAAQRFGERLARRIAQAHRLRRAVADQSAQVTAILTPGGRVAHAEGSGGDPIVRERLRTAVLRREKARTRLRHSQPDEALELFEGLVDGRFTVVDRFDNDGRRYLVAFENPPELVALRALTTREREILCRAIEGEPLKRIAVDLGLTPSAASAYLVAARKKTGLRTREEMVRWFRRLRQH
jgi:DNA-binding CsgD family transcriptional regulator